MHEVCKRLKFDHIDKCYRHKSESILENAIHKIIWNFDFQTENPIPVRRADIISINKKKIYQNLSKKIYSRNSLGLCDTNASQNPCQQGMVVY